MIPATQRPEDCKPSRPEWVLVLLTILLGFALRFAMPSRMSVEHFDEGVYASHLWFMDADATQYPDRFLYAPPLLPTLTGASIAILGPNGIGPMLISLLSGGLTVILLWWVARRWFGLEAALAVSLLAALSEFHLLYSRTALTDVLLGLWWLLAVSLIWEAYRRLHLGIAALAGIACGLAFWTKYNGWLPLGVAIAGLIPWMILTRPTTQHAVRLVGCWLVMAVTTFLIWLPVLGTLPQGYAAVRQNHARYFVGFAGWFDSFSQQVQNHRFLEGWLTMLSVGLGILIPALLVLMARLRFTWNESGSGTRLGDADASTGESSIDQASPTSSVPTEAANASSPRLWQVVAAAVGLTVYAVLFGASTLLGVLGVVGIAIRLVASRSDDDDPRAAETALAGWLLAAWFCGLLLATPFYKPYPRLTLPWLMAAWLGTASWIGWWLQTSPGVGGRTNPESAPMGSRHRVLIASLLGLAVAAVLVGWSGPMFSRRVAGWQDRSRLEQIAEQVRATASEAAQPHDSDQQADTPYVIYVYAQPSLVHHLAAASVIAYPATNLKFAEPDANQSGVPTFLLFESHAMTDPRFVEQWNRYRSRFQELSSQPYQPSDLVLLNRFGPKELIENPDRGAEFVELHQLIPSSQ